jgi:hypothetical protein
MRYQFNFKTNFLLIFSAWNFNEIHSKGKTSFYFLGKVKM